MKPLIRIEDGFYKSALKLRSHFDKNFSDPLDVHEERFVWDYWNVPDQYCHLRTPAYHYFSEKDYEDFHRTLVEWGREHLGCHDISPTWLSSYPEGSFQNVHVDEPHGPLAFVFSLTKSTRSFVGGQTIISRDRTLKGLSARKRELKVSPLDAFENYISVPPKFNRLIVFDPSYPHGVSETKGTKDPRRSRLVVHGWFVQPRPFWTGPLNETDVLEAIDEFVWGLSKTSQLSKCKGYISFRIQLNQSGQAQKVQSLVSTLNAKTFESLLLKRLSSFKTRSAGGKSSLTLPLVFS